jgi:hypothetical protein
VFSRTCLYILVAQADRREAFGNQIAFDSRLARVMQTDDSNKHRGAVHMKDQSAIRRQIASIVMNMNILFGQ